MFKERTTVNTTVQIFEKQPMIFIDVDALGKMQTYVEESSDEIGWLGTVKRQNNNYIIEDVYLFKQEVHATTCEITTEGLTEFANEILMLENGVELWNNMKLWGHSHVNMGVSPSGQDNEQMTIFKDCGHEFFIRVIANKLGEMEFTLYDFDNSLVYKNVKWTTLYKDERIWEIKQKIKELEAELKALQIPNIDKEYIKQEMKEKVSKKTFGIQYGGYGNYGSGQGVYYGDWWKKDTKKNETSTTNQKGREKDRYSVYTNGFIKACKTKDLALMEAYVIGDEIIEMASLKPTAICDVIDELFGDDITLGEAQTIKDACIAYNKASFYDIY